LEGLLGGEGIVEERVGRVVGRRGDCGESAGVQQSTADHRHLHMQI
jgi:hypothetical protein